jgi:hypothetical protein
MTSSDSPDGGPAEDHRPGTSPILTAAGGARKGLGRRLLEYGVEVEIDPGLPELPREAPRDVEADQPVE